MLNIDFLKALEETFKDVEIKQGGYVAREHNAFYRYDQLSFLLDSRTLMIFQRKQNTDLISIIVHEFKGLEVATKVLYSGNAFKALSVDEFKVIIKNWYQLGNYKTEYTDRGGE